MKLKNRPLTFYAMNALIILLIVIPKEIDTIFNILPVRLFAMSGLFLIFIWDYFKKNITLNTVNIKWYLIVYGLFLALTIPSFVNTKDTVTSFYTLVKFAMFCAVFFVFTKTQLEKDDYFVLLKTVLIAGSIVGVYAVIQYIFNINLNPMGTDKYDIKGRVYSTFFNPIYFSIFVNMIYFYCLYAFRKKTAKHYWALVIAVVLFAGLILSFTRSAILIFAAMLLGNIIFNFRFLWNKFVIITIALSISLVFLIPGALGVCKNALQYGSSIVGGGYLEQFTLDFDGQEGEDPDIDLSSDASLAHRADFAHIANQVAADNPYTGVGFGTYIDYMDSEDFSVKYSDYKGSLTHPHSFFILLSAETGYPAMAAYTLSIVILILMLVITWFRNLRSKNASLYRLNTLALIMVAGFVTTAYIAENSFYDTQISTLFFIVIGLTLNYINKASSVGPELNKTSIDETLIPQK